MCCTGRGSSCPRGALRSITGTPEEARQKLEAYRDHVDLMFLHAPDVPPLTVDDATDAFTNIVSTFAPRQGGGHSSP